MWCVAECDAVVMSQNVIQCCMMCSDVDLGTNDCATHLDVPWELT